MGKIFLVATLAAAIALGGCATGSLSNLSTAIAIGTKSIANPVTMTEEVQIEAAIDAAIVILKGYKQACIEGKADKNCRANIVAVQLYTRQMPPLIAQLRNFVDKNDQINAIVVYNQLTALYAQFKTTAGQLGYNVGSLP
jgi:formylmethanofuran dehydrogenase subunit B